MLSQTKQDESVGTDGGLGEGPPIRRWQRTLVAILVATAVVALLLFDRACLLPSWSPTFHWPSFVFIALTLALPTFHLAMSWMLLLRFRPRERREPLADASVDVFVTVTDEPLWMVERTLRAAVAIRYPHRTWLLEDGGARRFESLAEEVGSEYLARDTITDRKAGNVNHALERSQGEFVAIFDVDHVPHPDFLEGTLGPFDDAEVGFVQAMVTFSNHRQSLIALGSAQTAFDYYNIVSVAKDRLGAASLMGTNAVIRRTALERIGGYRPGLAEDLETSLALHADGWESVYVREPLAPGLAPSDFTAFCKQQSKWATGVFEASIAAMRGPFWRLRPMQRLCYLVRFSYYLLPILFAFNFVVMAGALIHPLPVVEKLWWPFVALVSLSLLLRIFVFRSWAREPEARRAMFVVGSSLVASSWPIYVASFLSVITRRKVPFRATPKLERRRVPLRLMLPQFASLALMGACVGWRAAHWSEHPLPVTTLFALGMMFSHWVLFVAAWGAFRAWTRERKAWKSIGQRKRVVARTSSVSR